MNIKVRVPLMKNNGELILIVQLWTGGSKRNNMRQYKIGDTV